METTRSILETYRIWAVVGISAKRERAGYRVPRFLKDLGYRIVPVNPGLTVWEGEKAWPDLLSIPFAVDVVDLFRRREYVPGHVDEAIRIGAKVVWMQLGIEHALAATRAREAGLVVVEDRCPMIEAQRFWTEGAGPRFERP